MSQPEGSASSSNEAKQETLSLKGGRGEHRPTQRTTFAPGETLAGRFRIVRFLGQGGMGEVYEAEDLELREHVALKTIRPEIASDQHALACFKREILLARKVTHPNVCRIFDFFMASHEPHGEVAFLTMELLRGETLAERLRREGRMAEAEALPIVRQMAAALAAAHHSGIVHRDFKAANVMLATPAGGVETFRAVVMDFGLARRVAADEATASALGVTAGIVGTPAYMAPEQVKGDEVTSAADIYALGVVMYEMVTAVRPFEAESPLAEAVKRLQETPASPRRHAPELDRNWEQAILRCLERDPACRFAAAADVVKALTGEAAPAPRVLGRPLVWVVAILLLVLAAAVAYRLRVSRPPPETAPAGQARARRSVAVLGFKNLSGQAEAAWLSRALAEMLTTELAAGEQLRAIPGENVARSRIELALAEAESFGKETLGRIRANLGADVVVLGSYVLVGDATDRRIRLDLRLQDAAAGETIDSVAETGTEAQLFELVSRSGARLRARLGVGGLSTAHATEVRASAPATPEAARLYSEGLNRLGLFDTIAARDLLARAAAADPNNSLVHAALAAAWSSLGYDAKAREEAKKAFELAGSLSRETRLSVEGRYRETTREWYKAVEIYQTLWNFFPDNLDYGLRLAGAQTSAGKGKDALAKLEALRKLPAPAGDDPRIDLAEAQAARSLSDNQRAQAASARAAAKGSQQSARLVLARARFEEGSALQDLGQLDQAHAALQEAQRMFTEAGDRRGAAGALNNIALVLAYRGDLAGARKMSEEALRIYRQIGNKSGEALMLSNLGNVDYMRGDLARARKMWEQTLATYREIGEKDGEARMLNNLASALATQGDLRGAKKQFEEALEVYRQIGQKNGEATALSNIAAASHDLGDPEAARKLHLEALAIYRQTGDKSYASSTLHDLGNTLAALGDLAGARKNYEQSLALRQETGAKGAAAKSRLALAHLLVEERRPAEAEAEARKLAPEFQQLRDADNEAAAEAALALALLAQGKTAEARKAADRAASVSRKSQNHGLRFSVAVTLARTQAATGGARTALQSLRNLVAEASKAGLVERELRARLALGEIELKGANPTAGRALLETVEKEARSRGFGLLAQKASTRL